MCQTPATVPLLALTMGDVNGIGPEVLARALARGDMRRRCAPVVFGSVSALEWARRFAPDCPRPVPVADLSQAALVRDGVPVMEWGSPGPEVAPGRLDPEAGRAAVVWIEAAVRAALSGAVRGMVTGPISKECIIRAGCPHTGHTSLIAAMTGSPDYRMCLFAGGMRIVHITAHLSLRDAIGQVRTERILRSALLADETLRRLGIAAPRIAVAGLNPHAGEAGTFGREEIGEIAPAVHAAVGRGVDCTGPHPPDTVFRRMHLGEFDAVVAMYHDQGHIPLKLLAMDDGVNVTLGIPIIRTSVDHGTAYDIAGKGAAREHSLLAAVSLAAQLAERGFGA